MAMTMKMAMKTSVIWFRYKRNLFALVNKLTFTEVLLLIRLLFRLLKNYRGIFCGIDTTAIFISRTVKIRKFKMLYFQNEGRFQAEKL